MIVKLQTNVKHYRELTPYRSPNAHGGPGRSPKAHGSPDHVFEAPGVADHGFEAPDGPPRL